MTNLNISSGYIYYWQSHSLGNSFILILLMSKLISKSMGSWKMLDVLIMKYKSNKQHNTDIQIKTTKIKFFSYRLI